MKRSKMISKKIFAGKVAVICGGSKGMGKAIAKDFVKMGGNVFIIARKMDNLLTAQEEIKQFREVDSQLIEIKSLDTTNRADFQEFAENFVQNQGVPDYLFNVVGYAHVNYYEKLNLSDFRNNMEVNFYGQLIPIMAFTSHFRKAKKGHIINFSSMMGYFGIMGYAAYAPTKFAIVGLTEALRHELKPDNVQFSIVYPPDTDTPGLQEENKSKPVECAKMSETAKLWTAEQVSESTLSGVYNKKYHILPGSAKSIWYLNRFMPWLVRMFTDSDYKKIRKKMGKNK